MNKTKKKKVPLSKAVTIEEQKQIEKAKEKRRKTLSGKKKLKSSPREKILLGDELVDLEKYRKQAPDYNTPGRKPLAQIFEETGEDKVIAQRIFLLASKGLQRSKIRYALKMSTSTWHTLLHKYADDFPIYKVALDRGEMYATEEVEHALKSRALGYYYEEVTDDEFKGRKVTIKHVPADTKAIQFYLTNKKPDEYKFKRDDTMTVNVNQKSDIDYTKLPPDVLKQLMIAAGDTVEEVETVEDEKDDK